MWPATYGLACAGTTGLVAVLLAGHASGSRRTVVLAKPLASLGFVAASLSVGAASTSYGQAVLVAQAFAFTGDVLLLGREKRTFVAGLFAFVLAHLALVSAFLGRGVAPVPVALAGAALSVAGAFALRWLLEHISGRMRWAVGLYVTVISAMVASAFGAAFDAPSPARHFIAAGAVTFYLSDLSVARERFVAKGLRNRLVGLPLYYGAQLLLAASSHLELAPSG